VVDWEVVEVVEMPTMILSPPPPSVDEPMSLRYASADRWDEPVSLRYASADRWGQKVTRVISSQAK
jgi:hypothetical protein